MGFEVVPSTDDHDRLLARNDVAIVFLVAADAMKMCWMVMQCYGRRAGTPYPKLSRLTSSSSS